MAIKVPAANGHHDHRSQSIYGDLIAVNRVKRIVAQVIEARNGSLGNGSSGLTTNAGPFTARAGWLESGGEDDLDSRRSIWDECGYPATRFMNAQRWQTLHDRDAIAATVNEAMARYAWQVTPDVYEKERGKVITPTDKAWKELGTQLRYGGMPDYFGEVGGGPIEEVLERANALSGIGRFGVIVYGLNDGLGWDKAVPGIVEDGSQPAEQHVDEQTGKPITSDSGQPVIRVNRGGSQRYSLNFVKPMTEGRKLGYMNAFSEHMVRPNRFESNKDSPRFGRPVSYQVTFQDPKNPVWGVGIPITTQHVHWTRVQHIADTVDTYGSSVIFGVPRCQSVLNNIMALQKLYHGGAEGFWKFALPYLFMTTHPQLGGDVDVDDESLKDMVEEMMNGLQKAGILSGMDAKMVGGNSADPSGQINVHLEAIAMKKRMPVRILKGSERGEMSSAQDDDSWDDQVVRYQTGYCTNGLVRPCVNMMIWYGVIPAPSSPKGLRCEWPDVTSMSSEQRAQLASTRAQAMSTYVNGGISQIMTLYDFYTRELHYSEEEAQQIINNVIGQEDDQDYDEQTEDPPEETQDWVPPAQGEEGQPPADGQGTETATKDIGEDPNGLGGTLPTEPRRTQRAVGNEEWQPPTDNIWTDEARAAAAEARKAHMSQSPEEVLKAHGGMVHKLAKQYADRNNLEDLKQEGNLGLLEAHQSFDPEKGAAFGTHAFYKVRARVQDAARRMKRQPQATGEHGAETTFDPVDTAPAETHDPVEGIHEAMKDLDSRSQAIVKSYYGLGGSEAKDFQQIGEEHGITKQRAGQIHAAAIARLKGSKVLGNQRAAEDLEQLEWISVIDEEQVYSVTNSNPQGINQYTHGTITDAKGKETTYEVVPDVDVHGAKVDRSKFRAQRVIKLPHEPPGSRYVYDFTRHKTFDEAKAEAIQRHDMDLREHRGKAKTTATANG